MTTTARHVAVLAPVPLQHLVSGSIVAAEQGKVAFGSRAWLVFRELDQLRGSAPVDVFIYASHSEPPSALEASWQGVYIGHVESLGGAHPDGMRFRPPSTLQYANDSSGKWAVFWEVRDLHEVKVKERHPIATMTGFGKKKSYGSAFWPEGPLLIEHP